MSQRFTVTAFSKSDSERGVSDIQGEVNQLFEGDEPIPSSSDKEGASNLSEDTVKDLIILISLQYSRIQVCQDELCIANNFIIVSKTKCIVFLYKTCSGIIAKCLQICKSRWVSVGPLCGAVAIVETGWRDGGGTEKYPYPLYIHRGLDFNHARPMIANFFLLYENIAEIETSNNPLLSHQNFYTPQIGFCRYAVVRFSDLVFGFCLESDLTTVNYMLIVE
ncbi:hypothetical protein P4O66_009456, partial [Electrophorus voltai]